MLLGLRCSKRQNSTFYKLNSNIFPEIMTKSVKIIHRPSCEQFHVGTFFLLLNYIHQQNQWRRRKRTSTDGREACAHDTAECKHQCRLSSDWAARLVHLTFVYCLHKAPDQRIVGRSRCQCWMDIQQAEYLVESLMCWGVRNELQPMTAGAPHFSPSFLCCYSQ